MMVWESQMDKLKANEKSVGIPPPTGAMGFFVLLVGMLIPDHATWSLSNRLAELHVGAVIANDVDLKRAATLTHQIQRVPSASIAITCLDGR